MRQTKTKINRRRIGVECDAGSSQHGDESGIHSRGGDDLRSE